MGDKMDNFKVVSSNPRSRMIMLGTGALLVGMVVIGFMGTRKDTNQPAEVAPSAETSDAPSVDSTPGTSTDPTYKALQDEANRKAAEAAESTGGTSLPVLTNTDGAPPAADPSMTITPATEEPVLQQPAPVLQQPAPVAPPVVNEAPAPTPAPPPTPVASDQMRDQVLGYLNKWGPKFTGGQEFSYMGQIRPVAAAPVTTAATAGSSSSSGAAGARSSANKPTFVRAGTIVPAILLTPINSTRPGPVLAQITTGPLAGSRLLGQFEASESSVAVVFTTITNPAWDSSYAVNAFAVGPDASPGLATDVNYHSFKKYGALLAGAFLAGMGDAVAQSSVTTTTIPGGGVVQSGRKLSSKEVGQVALGEVGQAVAQDVQQRGNLEPTIKVEGQNGPYPIGLLFMQNF